MSRASKLIHEVKLSSLKKGVKVKFKPNNFRYKGKEGIVDSIDDPETGDDEDVLVTVTVDGKKEEIGLEELQ